MDTSRNIESMSVSKMVHQLSNAYCFLIRSQQPFSLFPSVMLWGAPGVGKSQGVKQIASIIEEKTGKKVVVTDVRLLLFNPVDLRGIPTSNADKTLAVWLKPKIFQMDEDPNVVNILFLDEISAAPQSVQASAYQITLDRTVGEHKLPDNCIVMAAGNRVTDKSVSYAMPKALANRLCHLEIEGDEKSWHNWAVTHGVHDAVVSYIEYNPSRLMLFEQNKDNLAFPTPRTWEMVSNIMNTVSEDTKEIFPLLAGCIGMEAALEFRMWNEVYKRVDSAEDICSGMSIGIPTRPEGMYAITSRIVAYVRTHHSGNEVDNAIAYGYRLPPEFRSKMFADFLQLRGFKSQLKRNEYFQAWMKENGEGFDQ